MLFSTLLFTVIGLNAQIESTHTDEKFGYTTVVYKDKAATDKEVLAALESSIGMGDVIRVTTAPPKAAKVPVADKSKGEDLWLKTKPVANNLTASASPINTVPAKATVLPRKAAPAPAPTSVVATTAPVAANPVVKKVVSAPAPVVTPALQNTTKTVAAAPRVIKAKSSVKAKTTKSSKKTVKKAHRKSGSFKPKNRKKGKQQYGCPKF